MKDLSGRIAVVTGGGTGMGRELVRQLVADGCNVAMCDISAPAMAETRGLCETGRLPQGVRITTHLADVADETQVRRFLEDAPMTAAAAAAIILDGVKSDQWRILVGDDAHRIDEMVRQAPERAYDIDFFEQLAAKVGWRLGSDTNAAKPVRP